MNRCREKLYLYPFVNEGLYLFIGCRHLVTGSAIDEFYILTAKAFCCSRAIDGSIPSADDRNIFSCCNCFTTIYCTKETNTIDNTG